MTRRDGCPLCGGGERPALTRLAGAARSAYYRCTGCGFLHARPDESAESRFYREVYPHLPHKRFEADLRRPVFEAALSELLAEGVGRRLLDVGCGSGEFLALSRERGFAAVGLEIAPAAAAGARARSGAPIVLGDIEAVRGTASFDVITMWNVLDHVPDPFALAAAVHARLRPGGLLFVRLPNGSLHRLLMGLMAALGPRARRLAGLTPLHPWLFRPRDLELCLRRAGFGRRRIGPSPLTAGGHPRLRALLANLASASHRASAGRLQLAPSLQALAWRG